jgi:hypothetical protein
MFCMGSRTNGPRLQCNGFPHQCPLLHHVVQADHKVCHMHDTKNDAHPHSTEQDTQSTES